MYTRSNWRPCLYSWPYRHINPLNLLKYFYSFSARFGRQLLSHLHHLAASPATALRTAQDTFWSCNSADKDGLRDFLAFCYYNDHWVTLDVSTYISNFFKPGKPESPEWFNHTCDRAVKLRFSKFYSWCCSTTAIFHGRLMHDRKKYSVTIQRAKENSMRCKAVCPLSSAIDSWTFLSLVKAVSGISGLPISLLCLIPLVILLVELRVLVPGLPPIPI